ncbi:dTMP kinase [Candidatus Gracilibacteria bacterium]|nr:dTMP kinase [Candidatus Gracilibacteria bacterium]
MYIVFEGIVGSGKSTQSKKVVEYLRQKLGGDQVIHVREPGSTPIAEDIRHLAQGKEWENEIMHPLTNAYLYAAARAQTLHTIVRPALDNGKVVISDRSFLSSVAYQGVAQGLGMGTILRINEEAIKNIFPDVIFYMDIDVETSLSRTFDTVGDKWEKMGADFFYSIARGYDKCEKWKPLKDRFVRIDAHGTPEEVFDRIIQKLEPKL